MHVKYVQKDADAGAGLAVLLHDRNAGDLAVGWGHDSALYAGDGPLGIAKEPEEERGQKHRNDGQRRDGEPAYQRGNHKQRQSVIDAIANHGQV